MARTLRIIEGTDSALLVTFFETFHNLFLTVLLDYIVSGSLRLRFAEKRNIVAAAFSAGGAAPDQESISELLLLLFKKRIYIDEIIYSFSGDGRIE